MPELEGQGTIGGRWWPSAGELGEGADRELGIPIDLGEGGVVASSNVGLYLLSVESLVHLSGITLLAFGREKEGVTKTNGSEGVRVGDRVVGRLGCLKHHRATGGVDTIDRLRHAGIKDLVRRSRVVGGSEGGAANEQVDLRSLLDVGGKVGGDGISEGEESLGSRLWKNG